MEVAEAIHVWLLAWKVVAVLIWFEDD